jgi:hypothetical protein
MPRSADRFSLASFGEPGSFSTCSAIPVAQAEREIGVGATLPETQSRAADFAEIQPVREPRGQNVYIASILEFLPV